MTRRLVALGFSILIFTIAAAVVRGSRSEGKPDDQAPAVQVTIDNFSFTPKEITVAKGTIVTWINRDDVPHTIMSADKKFKSKALDTDDRFSFTFAETGTYAYFCSVHPIMTGRVVVK